jgi:hypothetical protein
MTQIEYSGFSDNSFNFDHLDQKEDNFEAISKMGKFISSNNEEVKSMKKKLW